MPGVHSKDKISASAWVGRPLKRKLEKLAQERGVTLTDLLVSTFEKHTKQPATLSTMEPSPALAIHITLAPGAVAPKRATHTDAGHDIHALESVTIPPGERATIGTGVSMAIPSGFYGRIAPRSGLAVKHGIQVLAGVVDAGYRGEIKVCLHNGGANPVTLEHGDRIAQIIFERCHAAEFTAVETLPESDRGAGGFGSSGTK